MELGWCSVLRGGLRVHLIPKVAHSQLAHAINDRENQSRTVVTEPSEDKRLMVVRHPLDRIVSAYTFFCKTRLDYPFNKGMENIGYTREMTFDEFLHNLLKRHSENCHTIKQIEYTGGHEIDYLIPIEKLNEAWPEIAKRYNLKALEVDKRNASNRNGGWEEYYTDEQRELAEEVFKEDLELYNLALEKYHG